MKKGFSMIEVLVVVVIIGILTMVSVPSYQKYVEKGRMSEALAFCKKFIDARGRLIDSAGTANVTATFDNLDIEKPRNCIADENQPSFICHGKHFSYSIFGNCAAERRGSSYDYEILMSLQPAGVKASCEGRNEKGEEFCKDNMHFFEPF
jgi:prepilin-type N-terminal cleavage/methylation domain-containing protein